MLEKVDLRIRHATVLDLPALEWDGEYQHFRRLYREAMEGVRKGRRKIFVAETGDHVIGQIFVNFFSSWRNSIAGLRTGYLHSFRVKPEYRNRGIGRKLIRTAEEVLIENGFHLAVIAVAQRNDGALRLYQKLGYEIFRNDPGRWAYIDHNDQVQHISEPAFILRKSL